MVSSTFNDRSMVHLMAILKRSVALIAGKNGVYLRLPGEEEDVKIRVWSVDTVG